MRFATALFALLAAASWPSGLGSARRSKCRSRRSPRAEKLNCISYAPFRAGQDPFGPDVPIDPRQIDEDLAQLKP